MKLASCIPIFQVFDYDRSSGDDFMGSASLELEPLLCQGWVILGSDFLLRSKEVCLALGPGTDRHLKRMVEKGQSLGSVLLRLEVMVIDADEEVEEVEVKHKKVSAVKSFMSSMQRSPSRVSFSNGAISNRTGVVHIVVVQARGLVPPRARDAVTSLCKLVLGGRKHKTRAVCSFNPKWQEGFSMSWHQGQDDFVEITVLGCAGEKDAGERVNLGRWVGLEELCYITLFRASIDLKHLKRERTHNLWLPMKDRLQGDTFQHLLTSSRLGDLPPRVGDSPASAQCPLGGGNQCAGDYQRCSGAA